MTVSTVQDTVVVDLDGVVWLAGEVLPGASDAVAALRGERYRVLFVTNNSSPTIAALVERLGRSGIETMPRDLVTSAQAAASLVPSGDSVVFVGDEGLREAIGERGLTESPDPTAVIVGWSRSFTFDVIARVADVVRHGARFIATNDDPTHPTPEGLLPGTGALVSAIATAAETLPTIAGKPGKAMAALVQERSEKICMVIGDRPSTDGAFAQILGVDFGLVRSEATPAIADIGPLEGPSLLAVVEDFLAPSSRASR